MKIKPLLIASISLLGATALVFAADSPAASVPAEVALERLKEGNARFATAVLTEGKPVAFKREKYAQAQSPFAIVVACSDSRTAPELVFDQNIGGLFVVRNAGNLVDDYGLGSIEYAVEHLGTRLIVVLGHQRCGAVQAALAGDSAPGHVGSLVRDIQPAVAAVKGKDGDPLDLAIAENTRLVAAKIREKAAFGDLASQVRVVSGVYNLDTGKVEWLKE